MRNLCSPTLRILVRASPQTPTNINIMTVLLVPRSPWCSRNQTEPRLRQLLSDAEKHINESCDVDALCRGAFLERMQELNDALGDRLTH